MSSKDPVGATREALAALTAAAARVRNEYGATLGVRRLTTDIDRIAADLDELGEPQPGHVPGVDRGSLLEVPDDPYDESMWQDAESEGQHAH